MCDACMRALCSAVCCRDVAEDSSTSKAEWAMQKEVILKYVQVCGLLPFVPLSVCTMDSPVLTVAWWAGSCITNAVLNITASVQCCWYWGMHTKKQGS